MFKNKKFRKYALAVVLVGFVLEYFYAGLQTDHLNVITPYLTNTYGWTTTQITNPITFGGLVSIAVYLVTATAFIRFGIKRFMIPTLSLITLSVVGLALSNGNYIIYFISIFVLRSITGTLSLAAMNLCTNWFSRYRGRALGIIVVGPPMFTCTGTALLTLGVESRLGFCGTYLMVGVILAVCVFMFIRVIFDSPEAVGLKPDGEDTEAEQVEEVPSIVLPLKELLRHKESWLMMVAFAIFNFAGTCYIGFYAASLIQCGVEQSVYLPALTVGAIVAFPVSFLIGAVVDRFGTCWASLICMLVDLIPAAVYLFVPNKNFFFCALIMFCAAGMGGAYGSVMPTMITTFFGRARYNSANRWIFTFYAIAMSFAALYMSYFLDHTLATAYVILFILIAIGAACSLALQFIGKPLYKD